MLSAEKNKILTQVGPGTPMGDYLRRYWMPIGGASELDANPIKAIRLLGEDLVLYKDLGGRYGLVDRHCPHRRADLSYGLVEETGIRCNYHGWLMDEAGRVIEQPYDDIVNPGRAQGRCTTKAYPVKECAGLLFAYMGPQPVPELPVWEPFTWENGFREVVISDIPCNWFQCQENSCDPVHFEWMHENWNTRLNGADRALCSQASQARVRGVRLRLRLQARARRPARGRPGLDRRTRGALAERLLSRQSFRMARADRRREHAQRLLVLHAGAEGPRALCAGQGADLGAARSRMTNGRWISSHVINQDIIAWVGQGTIADRTKETLGASDLGIAMMRKRFFDELDAVAKGAEPKATLRNANVASCIELPNITKKTSVEGITLAEHENYPLLKVRLKGFRHCAGQPPEVRRAFEEAMGIGGT